MFNVGTGPGILPLFPLQDAEQSLCASQCLFDRASACFHMLCTPRLFETNREAPHATVHAAK